MKRKDIQSLQNAKSSELQKMLSEREVSLAQIAKDRYTKQSKNVHLGKFLRIEIARIKTILRNKELSV
jgi:ribosomal protein L29